MQKLFVIVRSDLPPGPQAVQATHAALQHAFRFAERLKDWHVSSNNLALLQVPDEAALGRLEERVLAAQGGGEDVTLSAFREPDYGDSMTALCLFGANAHRLVSSLPLALKGRRAA